MTITQQHTAAKFIRFINVPLDQPFMVDKPEYRDVLFFKTSLHSQESQHNAIGITKNFCYVAGFQTNDNVFLIDITNIDYRLK